MTLPPPRRPHYQGEPSQYRPVQQHHVAAQRQDKAPTLGQYWRSDTRTVPGRKPAKWAGRAALWLGILAAVLFFGGTFIPGVPTILAAFAAPLSVVAVIFALIAIIAGSVAASALSASSSRLPAVRSSGRGSTGPSAEPRAGA